MRSFGLSLFVGTCSSSGATIFALGKEVGYGHHA